MFAANNSRLSAAQRQRINMSGRTLRWKQIKVRHAVNHGSITVNYTACGSTSALINGKTAAAAGIVL